MHFKRTDVDPTVHYAIESGAALVEERRRSEARIACISSWAAEQKLMRKSGSAVVLQRAEHGIGIDLIAGPD